MNEIPVIYATTEGQTRRIAERLASGLRRAGLDSQPVDVTSPQAHAIEWVGVRGVIVAASLHVGSHQRQATAFVRAQRARLNARPSLFVSVSLSAASTRPAEREAAERIARTFGTETGWQPSRVACVAGALTYTQYGFLKRWLMRQIARREGGPLDISRDHDLTDWAAVDRLAAHFAAQVLGVRRSASGIPC